MINYFDFLKILWSKYRKCEDDRGEDSAKTHKDGIFLQITVAACSLFVLIRRNAFVEGEEIEGGNIEQ